MNPLIIAAFSGASRQDLVQIPPTFSQVHNTALTTDTTMFSGINFYSDGHLYSNQDAPLSGATLVDEGLWMLSGLQSDYYMEYETTGGTNAFALDEIGSENTRVQMSFNGGNMRFNLTWSFIPGSSTNVSTFKIYDAPTGGTLLTSKSLSFSAVMTAP